MRMTGFSGIDVADMVQQMMRAESFRLDRLRQQRDLSVWRQDMMRNVATSITQFNRTWTQPFAMGGRDIGNPDNWNSNSVNITGGVGATITAGANARQGTHTLNVTQIAQAHTFRTNPANSLNASNPGATTSAIDFTSLLGINTDNLSPNYGNVEFVSDLTIRMNVSGVARDVTIDKDTLNGIIAGNPALDASGSMANHISEIATAQAEIEHLLSIGRPNNHADIVNRRNHIQYHSNHLRELPYFGDLTTSTAFASALNDAVDTAFNTGGETRASVEILNGHLAFIATQGNTVNILNATNGLTAQQLGLSSTSSSFNTQQNLAGFLNIDPTVNPSATDVEFTINNRTFSLNLYDNSIMINGEPVARASNASGPITVQELVNVINGSGAGVNVSFSAVSGQFTIQASQTGTSSAITADLGIGGFLQSIMGLDPNNNNAAIMGSVQTQAAQNAIVTVNDTAITRENNNFTVDDLTINLTSAAEGEDFTIQVSRNTSDIRTMVTDFVNSYNELMRSLIDLTEVRRPRQDRDGGFFMPLTDEQRRDMSDREIEIWEEQARTGILHRDESLRAIQREMTDVLFRNITMPDGRTFNLGNMGIQLSSDVREFGMLEINEERFAFALEHHSDVMQELFTAVAPPLNTFTDSTDPRVGSARNQWVNASGLAQRLNDVFNRATAPTSGTLSLRAGVAGGALDTQNDMSRQISDQNRRIDNMLSWLERREDSLFRQFSRMEMAMMQAQSQMMFFEQLMWGNM